MHVPKRQKISRLANDAPQLLERCQRIDFGGAAFKPTQFILKTAVEHIPANKNQHKLDKENCVM